MPYAMIVEVDNSGEDPDEGRRRLRDELAPFTKQLPGFLSLLFMTAFGSVELAVASDVSTPLPRTRIACVSTAEPSLAPMVTVPVTPSSSTLMSAPVSCCKVLMTLPLGPITSPILSIGISMLTILGAVSRTLDRGSEMASSMTARIL